MTSTPCKSVGDTCVQMSYLYEFVCLLVCVCVPGSLSLCVYSMSTEERQFDKLIHSKHPNGNIPTGCFSSAMEIIFAFQLPPTGLAAFAREMGARHDTYTPDIWFAWYDDSPSAHISVCKNKNLDTLFLPVY